MAKQRHPEGMRLARLLMVLSSISPLFILWGIRGNSLVPDSYFLSFCGVMIIVPNLFLWLRIRTARKLNEKRELVVGTAEDHREHLLVYLFAMLLPFYAADLGTYRDLAAALAALGFIVFLFWHLNLHYMNLFFAVLGMLLLEEKHVMGFLEVLERRRYEIELVANTPEHYRATSRSKIDTGG